MLQISIYIKKQLNFLPYHIWIVGPVLIESLASLLETTVDEQRMVVWGEGRQLDSFKYEII